jgi:hypothetical protein
MGEMTWCSVLLGYDSEEAAKSDEITPQCETHLLKLTYIDGADVANEFSELCIHTGNLPSVNAGGDAALREAPAPRLFFPKSRWWNAKDVTISSQKHPAYWGYSTKKPGFTFQNFKDFAWCSIISITSMVPGDRQASAAVFQEKFGSRFCTSVNPIASTSTFVESRINASRSLGLAHSQIIAVVGERRSVGRHMSCLDTTYDRLVFRLEQNTFYLPHEHPNERLMRHYAF